MCHSSEHIGRQQCQPEKEDIDEREDIVRVANTVEESVDGGERWEDVAELREEAATDRQ